MSNFENLVEYFSVYLNTFAYVCHVFEYFSTYSAPFFMICHYVLAKQSIPEYQDPVSFSRWDLLNPSQHWFTSGSMAANVTSSWWADIPVNPRHKDKQDWWNTPTRVPCAHELNKGKATATNDAVRWWCWWWGCWEFGWTETFLTWNLCYLHC